jgi:alkylation response protein AidB-like acyl-CoA dehydrogenase
MTEPDAGSDLAGMRSTAIWDGDAFVLNGQKTFITNAINSDAVIVAARTDPTAGHRGVSLLVVEQGMPGFERGRKLDKLGMRGQDTGELFFQDVRVPRENLLGTEGRGFYHLMENLAQERLSIVVAALAQARGIFDRTLEYVKGRTAFGKPIGSMQANKHLIADMLAQLDIAQVYVDACLQQVLEGELSAVEAAKAKLWVCELAVEVVNKCLQLFGGYGYMREYDVARAYVDMRYMTIGGGSSEIMREIIGKDLGL